MKKRAVVALLVLLMLVLGACAGLGDWKYLLPNGYELWRVDSEQYDFGERQGSFLTPAVDGSVRRFCYNDRYVGLQVKGGSQSEETVFYLVDTETGAVSSAKDETAFQALCEQMQVAELSEWMETSSAPKGAIFPE